MEPDEKALAFMTIVGWKNKREAEMEDGRDRSKRAEKI